MIHGGNVYFTVCHKEYIDRQIKLLKATLTHPIKTLTYNVTNNCKWIIHCCKGESNENIANMHWDGVGYEIFLN